MQHFVSCLQQLNFRGTLFHRWHIGSWWRDEVMKKKSGKNITNRQRRVFGEAIAAFGMVRKNRNGFEISMPDILGQQTQYFLVRDTAGRIFCSCSEFQSMFETVESFECEHTYAVQYALDDGDFRAGVIEPFGSKSFNAFEKGLAESANQSITTESRMSGRGEQENAAYLHGLAGRRADPKIAGLSLLVGKTGETKMKAMFINEEFEKMAATENEVEAHDNVLSFSTTLKELRKNVDPQLVKQREGWRDRNGHIQMVDYVEWHTVADILDETAPNWSHAVKDIRQIGEIMTVTVAITIDGITREGIGTGAAQSEIGIKKAEHDALKRAAVKFGIARDLYRKESDVIEHQGSAVSNDVDGFPTNPIAGSLSELVTAKQLGMIRAIGRELGIDPDDECSDLMDCKTGELSRRAASSLIQHLQEKQRNFNTPSHAPLRRAS